MTSEGAWREQRRRMVAEQLEAHGIRDARVLAAMEKVPRHLFVRPADRDRAYGDHPLPIGWDQTISQPFVVARMAELCDTRAGDRALEIGAGSGYMAAVLCELGAEVFAVEIVPELAAFAAENLRAAGCPGVHVERFDGTHGWSEQAPYDVIVVSAGAPRVPPLLLAQLADRGRLVMPVGERGHQTLVRVARDGDAFAEQADVGVRFVDLTGRYGRDGRGPPEA